MDERLLAIVVCPNCRSTLKAEPNTATANRLDCTDQSCGLSYPVRDGVPVLLVDEATRGQ